MQQSVLHLKTSKNIFSVFLFQHVQDILISWQEDLKGCALIFYRAVGSLNQAALFGKPSPLRKEDPRVRMLPFPTRKPSFKEVKRVHQVLASIEVYGKTLVLLACLPQICTRAMFFIYTNK